MAIQVSGTEVISNSRALNNIASVDATTAAAITAAGVGGGASWSLAQTSTIASKSGTGVIGSFNLSNAFSYTMPSGIKGLAVSMTIGSAVRSYSSGGTASSGLILSLGASMSSNAHVAAAPANWSGGSATYYGQTATVSFFANPNGYDSLNSVEKLDWQSGYRATTADPNYSPHEYGASPQILSANAGTTLHYTATPFDAGNPAISNQVTLNNVTLKIWVLS